jgi:hypothetical protein
MSLVFDIIMWTTSIVGLTFIIERGVALRWNKVVPPAIENAVDACRSVDDLPTLRSICERHPSSLGRLLMVADKHLDLPKKENENTLQTAHARKSLCSNAALLFWKSLWESPR